MSKIYTKTIFAGVVAVIVFILTGLLFSIPLWLLWNWLMPHIFGLPTINILEAFGLSALVTLLSPRQLNINNKQDTFDNNTDKKLQEVLRNITSHFQA